MIITDASPLFSPNTATQDQAIAFVKARGSYYKPDAITEITGYIWDGAPALGLDANKVFAQIVHETSEHYPTAKDSYKPLSSWWAQRPRRNSGGMGVNGVISHTSPPEQDAARWAMNPKTGVWYHGYSFSTWQQTIAIHLGWLLLYCLPVGAGTDAQRAAIARTLAFRGVPFPTGLRGTVSCLRELGAAHNRYNIGKPRNQWAAWADPGDEYGVEVAEIATTISEVKI